MSATTKPTTPADVLRDRTAEMLDHDIEPWTAWQDVPFELWPPAALESYLADTPWRSAWHGHEPTGTEMRQIIASALGNVTVIPSTGEPQ